MDSAEVDAGNWHLPNLLLTLRSTPQRFWVVVRSSHCFMQMNEKQWKSNLNLFPLLNARVWGDQTLTRTTKNISFPLFMNCKLQTAICVP